MSDFGETYDTILKHDSAASAKLHHIFTLIFDYHPLICSEAHRLLLSSDNPPKTDYLQKCWNAVELNSSLNGTSARNSLHSSSAFSRHSLG